MSSGSKIDALSGIAGSTSPSPTANILPAEGSTSVTDDALTGREGVRSVDATSPGGEIDATQEIDAADATNAVSSAVLAHGVVEVAGVDGLSEASGLSPLGAKVVDGISSGTLSVEAARDSLIEGIVERQLGPDAPPELANAIRDEVRTLLEGDPTLAELLG